MELQTMTRIRYQHHYGWIIESDPNTQEVIILWDNNPNYHRYTQQWVEEHTSEV